MPFCEERGKGWPFSVVGWVSRMPKAGVGGSGAVVLTVLGGEVVEAGSGGHGCGI